MANERLRAAITSAGHTTDTLAEELQVDPKTIQRWIALDRIPHRRSRQQVARLLDKEEAFLWPAVVDEARMQSASRAEFVELHVNRGAVPVDTWQSLLEGSREAIDVLAFAATFVHDSLPDFDRTLAERARSGVRVRLAFGDPASDAVRIRGEEEGLGDAFASRCRITWMYLRELIGEPGIEARAHSATLYNSIFRFDDELFANTHVLGSPANHSPVLHIHRISGGRLFDHFMAGFERTWSTARVVDQGWVA
jgi:hypothetical protein